MTEQQVDALEAAFGLVNDLGLEGPEAELIENTYYDYLLEMTP